MNLALIQDHVVALFLHVVRVGAFLAVAPMFGKQADSAILRLILALSLGAVFWWVGDQQVELPDSVLALGVVALREGLLGLAFGFALATTTSLLVSAGEVISTEMGFSMARTMNPESGVDATVVSQLLQVFGFLLILHFNLHHDALRLIDDTFRVCRIGQPFDIDPLWHGLRGIVSGSVMLAVQYSFPILGTMFLLSIGMVLLGRAVPAINLMEFGFALRIVVAMLLTAFFLVEGAPFLLLTFRGVFDGAAAMLHG